MRYGRVCIFTQTPFTRLLREVDAHEPLDLDGLEEGIDCLQSPGGVTRMVRALVASWEETDRIKRATWVSLAASPTPAIRLSDRTVVEHVSLSEIERSEYSKAKGDLWNAIHGLTEDVDLAAVDVGLSHIARAMTVKAVEAHHHEPFDTFYVHDFQLMRLAKHLPDGVPVAFHWHGPAHPMDAKTEAYLARCLNEFDMVVVSTRRYATELRRMGVHVPLQVSYPCVPEPPARAITRDDIDAFDARFGLTTQDAVFTVVARLDPIKSQDVAIRALARIVSNAPHARLLIVGGGGFSGGRGGLGMGHAVEWREALERLATELGVRERVTFTGGILDDELELAYARSRAVVLPSRVEGWGLAPVEAWQRGVPVIVSSGTGVAELVRDGENGYVFHQDDVAGLAAAMMQLATSASRAVKMGRAGQRTAANCAAGKSARDIWSILRALTPTTHGASWVKRSTRVLTLITDLDRTLTGPDLKLDERARRMLCELRDAGVHVILATGRPLAHVVQLGLRELTDAIVVENGAIVMNSRTRETHIVGAAFRTQAERALGDLASQFSWHRVSGSGPRELAEEAHTCLRASGIDHHIEFNAEHVMLLPPGVDKSTGALTALRMLGIRSRNLWAIGDGENDVALFRLARESAAPSQASASVVAQATMKLDEAYSAGFVQFAKRLLLDRAFPLERAWVV